LFVSINFIVGSSGTWASSSDVMIDHFLEDYASCQILPIRGICEDVTALLIAPVALGAVVWSWVI